MQFENPMTFVRAIKGAPSSVLWALVFTKQMMTALELQQWTGYKGDNLTVALRLLIDLGWVVARSSRGPWGLAEGRQLPLMGAFLEDREAAENPESDLIGVRSLIDVNVESEESGENKATSLTNRRLNPIKSESREKVLSVKTIVKAEEDIAACLAVLNEAGIFGKKADEIAEDWHIMPETISGHLVWAHSEHWDNPNGMAIYRLLNNVPVPELRSNGHTLTCGCVSCQILEKSKRYSESEFSDFVNRTDEEEEESEEE